MRARACYSDMRGFGLPRENVTALEVENALMQGGCEVAPELAQRWEQFFAGQDEIMANIYRNLYDDDANDSNDDL
jgi:hypothetical protein